MKMKVIDKIRAMSADELAEWLQRFCACEICELRNVDCFGMGLTPEKCIVAIKKHLESEVIEREIHI